MNDRSLDPLTADDRVSGESGGHIAQHGWSGTLRAFARAETAQLLSALQSFVPDAGPPQINAWRNSLRLLRGVIETLSGTVPAAAEWGLVFEYQLPLEARRADAVILAAGAVVVLEFKGKTGVSPADVDQTHAYARDLRSYHDACHEVPVYPVLVPTQAGRMASESRGVLVRGPDRLAEALLSLYDPASAPIVLQHFLSANAYRPLPSLVAAARELIRSGTLRRVHRAAAATEATVAAITEIARQAATDGSRHLVLLTGVPGAGKTLVGLQVVHAHLLDDLAAPRQGRRPAAPAVFLSGNGPLVEVLQYELKGAGGGGKTFVRGVKDYVATTTRGPRCRRRSMCWSSTKRSGPITRRWWSRSTS